VNHSTTERAPLVSSPIALGYILGTVLFVIAGWIWYVKNHYTFVYDNNFISSCEAQGASVSACDCSLDIVKRNYSYKTAKAIENSGQYPQSLLQRIQDNCR